MNREASNADSRAPSFEFTSGICTAMGLVPHVLFLTVLFVAGLPPMSLPGLVAWTIIAKGVGEWLFWKRTKEIVGEGVSSQTISLHALSSKRCLTLAGVFLVDNAMDIFLLSVAIMVGTTPMVAFLTLLGAQVVGAPILGYRAAYRQEDLLLLPIALLLGLGLSLLAATMAGFLNIDLGIANVIFGSSTPAGEKLLILLAIKGLFASGTPIARGALAKELVI